MHFMEPDDSVPCWQESDHWAAWIRSTISRRISFNTIFPTEKVCWRRNISASHSGRDRYVLSGNIKCSDSGLSWFTSVYAQKSWGSTSNSTAAASFHILTSSLFTNVLSFEALHAEVMRASLNKAQINNTSFHLRLCLESCPSVWFKPSTIRIYVLQKLHRC